MFIIDASWVTREAARHYLEGLPTTDRFAASKHASPAPRAKQLRMRGLRKSHPVSGLGLPRRGGSLEPSAPPRPMNARCDCDSGTSGRIDRTDQRQKT